MPKVYCLRCREKTKNDGEGKVRKTKNGRRQLVVACAKCGGDKYMFLPNEEWMC